MGSFPQETETKLHRGQNESENRGNIAVTAALTSHLGLPD